MRSHTPKGKETRDGIVAVAEELYAERGFHGTSMRDIAAAAKLPLASTIYHFARKEKLYRAVLEGIAAELMTELEAAIGPARIKGDLVERFVAPVDTLARALVRWSAQYPRRVRLLLHPGRVRLLLRELLDNPTRVRKAAAVPLGPFLERAAAMIASGVKAGVLEPRTPETAVLHVVGGLHYVVASAPTVQRIVGAGRKREIDARYDREALAFARHTFGVPAAYALMKDKEARGAA
jgi:AcrR family transcriptional regulator